ncbi:uncharacterized protein GIQ15_00612 [Arthroderma uncinatum]|uniref:uncharacterized protein n=1 Tax=Arthroderma uncinatum TaxID=74035 RepID=UPI00144AD0DF|nr:uncharacterized protein GIQ15_00612 [Arthroderma uncinatum]KAF3491095.1 hypothetical protein GIQ15_00612 [Arthroderma uncinatum]
MASYVTIEKQYFETLLRRTQVAPANLYSRYTLQGQSVSSSEFDTPADIPTVTILKPDHDDMSRRCREYVEKDTYEWHAENLKRALYQGGVEQSSIETLIKDSGVPQGASTTNGDYSSNGYSRTSYEPTQNSEGTEPANRYSGRVNARSGTGTHQPSFNDRSTRAHTEEQSPMHHGSFDNNDDDSFPSDDRLESPIGDGPSAPASSRHGVNGTENRTVAIKNVPERATHRDITAVVRGGALVDVFLRSRDHMASVSFADTKAAQEFYTYAKRCNLCILDRPVDISWAERQYSLSTYLSSQMANGASRNLIIRGVHPNITESMIREDMRHIHNLIIVSLTFNHGNVYISTNSVQKASFARNCMMSRMPYRIMRIEYYQDECADPLPKIKETPVKVPSRPAKTLNPMANRFQMLHLDESEDESDDQDDVESNGPLGGGISWRNNTIAV